MSHDPAVEAAQRAWDGTDCHGFASQGHAMEAAARAALAPIRELHKPYLCHCDTPHHACEGCLEEWPCDTARLIYTSEELTND